LRQASEQDESKNFRENKMTEARANPLVNSGKPLFFKVANPEELGVFAPAIRLGEAVRLCVRSLSVMQ
jgi:hypothetical protein